ncbi:hypothetical protein M514_10199 [Trichuris suis]|uniref:RNase NYN domain-containing protein n=1 Tax=Trichuris suis TaxID=68888 RepID=A0A085NG48_9BILA|nr:hypothetical protein M514_10199 [Trichuris suis]
MSDALISNEIKTADERVSSLQSRGAGWNSKMAHQEFCELLKRLRIKSESLFSILREEDIVPNESCILKLNSTNVGSLKPDDRTSSKPSRTCANDSLRMELPDGLQSEPVYYFRTYGVLSVQGSCCPRYPRRPIVVDGSSCGTLMELLCSVRYFLRRSHCVIALLPEKTFNNWCRHSSTSAECLLCMKLTGLLSPIPAEVLGAEKANLVVDSNFNRRLLKLAYLTGGVLLSNRRLVALSSGVDDWERWAANRCLSFQIDRNRELKFAPTGRHSCTTLKSLLEFSSDSRAEVLVRAPVKSQLDDLIFRLDGFLSRLGEVPRRVKRSLMCA